MKRILFTEFRGEPRVFTQYEIAFLQHQFFMMLTAASLAHG